jgi:hypothetical protein
MKKIHLYLSALDLSILSRAHFAYSYDAQSETLELCECYLSTLKTISDHGMLGGVIGFVSTFENATFFFLHKKEMIEALNEDAESFGCCPLEMVASFYCLNGAYSTREILSVLAADSIEDIDSELWSIAEAVTWMCAERCFFKVFDYSCAEFEPALV